MSQRSSFKRIASLSNEGAWILAGQIASVSFTLGLVKFLTTRLSPSEYGSLALALTMATLGTQIFTGGLINGAARFFPIAEERNDLRRFVATVFRMYTLACVAICGTTIITSIALYLLSIPFTLPLSLSTSVLSILSSANGILCGMQTAARQRAIVSLHSGIEGALKISCSALIISVFESSATAAIAGLSVASLLITLSQLYFFQKRHLSNALSRPQLHTETNWEKSIWHFSWPFSLWGIFTWIQQSSDKWALSVFAGEGTVGNFAVVYQLGYAPMAAATNLAMALFSPIIFSQAGDGSSHARIQAAKRGVVLISGICVILTCICTVLAFAFNRYLFQYLTTLAYQEYAAMLPIAVAAGGIFAAGQFLSLRLLASFETSKLLAIKIATAVFGTLLNLLAASLFGAPGVLVSLLMFSIVYTLAVYFSAFSNKALSAAHINASQASDPKSATNACN
jgi:O-antigen/teichoic acid export membrane protein